MDVSLSDCKLLDFEPSLRPRKGIGGPSSADGKKTSSQNARKHGCRSKEKFVPGERRKDYDALWEQWLAVYEPENPGDLALLERVVDAAWRLRRAERVFTKTERALHRQSREPGDWPAEMVARLQVMQRYRTTAENSLHKELRLLEFLKGKRDGERRHAQSEAYREQREWERWEAMNPEQAKALRQWKAEQEAQAKAEKPVPSPAQLLFRGQNCVTLRQPAVRLEQWAEIRVRDGQTVTELFPSNHELMEMGKALMPPPTVVDRVLNFFDGIPVEYEWVGVPDELREQGGSGRQRMTPDAWLELIEQEAATGEGHLLPTPQAVRREQIDDSCDCPFCVTLTDILKRQTIGPA